MFTVTVSAEKRQHMHTEPEFLNFYGAQESIPSVRQLLQSATPPH
jgi:hypothetical protein